MTDTATHKPIVNQNQPSVQDLYKDLVKMEESYWLPNELRHRYRMELVELCHQYEKASRDGDFDDALLKTFLSHISLYADRLIDLTTRIEHEPARRAVLRLELSQFPLQEEVPEAVAWYRDRALNAKAGPAVTLHDGSVRQVLYSPNQQHYASANRVIPARGWFQNPKRLFMRAIEMIFQ